MKFLRFLKVMFLSTALLLMYVHIQMQIIKLAYEGKEKEAQIRRLAEENGNITYAILSLKSSSNLGLKLLEENTDLQFADPQSVLQVSALDSGTQQLLVGTGLEQKPRTSNPLLSLLSFGTEAEARVRR